MFYEEIHTILETCLNLMISFLKLTESEIILHFRTVHQKNSSPFFYAITK